MGTDGKPGKIPIYFLERRLKLFRRDYVPYVHVYLKFLGIIGI
jgi:hypothetical protein